MTALAAPHSMSRAQNKPASPAPADKQTNGLIGMPVGTSMKTITLDDGQHASVVISGGRITKILAANGQVAELKWRDESTNGVARDHWQPQPTPGSAGTSPQQPTPPQAVQQPYTRTARTPDNAQQPPHPGAASPFALPPSRQASGASSVGPGPHRVTSQRELPSSPVSSTGSDGGLLQAASRHASVTVKQPGLLPGQEGAPGWRRGAVGELVRQQQRSPGMEQQRTGSFFPTGSLDTASSRGVSVMLTSRLGSNASDTFATPPATAAAGRTGPALPQSRAEPSPRSNSPSFASRPASPATSSATGSSTGTGGLRPGQDAASRPAFPGTTAAGPPPTRAAQAVPVRQGSKGTTQPASSSPSTSSTGHPRAVDLGRQHLAALAAQQRQQSGPSNPAWNPAASWIPREPQQYGQAGQASIPPQYQPHPQQQQRGATGTLASGGSGPLQNGMAPAGSGASGPTSSPRPPVASRGPSSRNRGFEGLAQDDLERAKRSRLNTAPVWLRSQSMPMQTPMQRTESSADGYNTEMGRPPLPSSSRQLKRDDSHAAAMARGQGQGYPIGLAAHAEEAGPQSGQRQQEGRRGPIEWALRKCRGGDGPDNAPANKFRSPSFLQSGSPDKKSGFWKRMKNKFLGRSSNKKMETVGSMDLPGRVRYSEKHHSDESQEAVIDTATDKQLQREIARRRSQAGAGMAELETVAVPPPGDCPAVPSRYATRAAASSAVHQAPAPTQAKRTMSANLSMVAPEDGSAMRPDYMQSEAPRQGSRWRWFGERGQPRSTADYSFASADPEHPPSEASAAPRPSPATSTSAESLNAQQQQRQQMAAALLQQRAQLQQNRSARGTYKAPSMPQMAEHRPQQPDLWQQQSQLSGGLQPERQGQRPPGVPLLPLASLSSADGRALAPGSSSGSFDAASREAIRQKKLKTAPSHGYRASQSFNMAQPLPSETADQRRARRLRTTEFANPADTSKYVPTRSGMAGRWRKNVSEGSDGSRVDELLQLSTLQRLARQRITEMEILETDEVLEVIWNIPLGTGSVKIRKTDRYLKNSEVCELQRRDGRHGALRSQLNFTPEGHIHIRALQADPFAAVFHDRIKMSTGGHRLKIEQKFQLLAPGVTPVKHYSIWHRTEEGR